jgi:hypothetical protein
MLCAAAFWHVYQFSFVIGWDDQTFVTNQYTEDGLYLKNIYSIFTEFYHGQYAPINQLYYSTLFEIFDYNPVSFHLGSLIIHIINALLVYKFCMKLCSAIHSYSQIKCAQLSLVVAILFMIAPINIEPVAWISASKVLIYASFYLIALLFYIKYISQQGNKYYYMALLFFILAFGAKEQAVSLSFTMLLLDYIYKRDLRNKIVWYEKVPMIILSLLFALSAIQSQEHPDGVIAANYSFTDRIPLFFYTLSEYFTKIIIPINLSYAYPFPFQIGSRVPLWLWMYPMIIPLIIYCLQKYLNHKWLLFGSVFFLINIILVCNIISLNRHSLVADRYAYIASIGIYFSIASGLAILLPRTRREYILPLAIGYLFYFFIYTIVHSQLWENSYTLKEKMRTIIKSRVDYKSWKIKKTNEGH